MSDIDTHQPTAKLTEDQGVMFMLGQMSSQIKTLTVHVANIQKQLDNHYCPNLDKIENIAEVEISNSQRIEEYRKECASVVNEINNKFKMAEGSWSASKVWGWVIFTILLTIFGTFGGSWYFNKRAQEDEIRKFLIEYRLKEQANDKNNPAAVPVNPKKP